MTDEKARRPKGDGGVWQRGPRKFLIRYDIPSPDGKRSQRSETVNGTERQARARLRKLLEDRDKGVFSTSTKETVSEFVATRWQPHLTSQVRPQTAQWYIRLYRQHIAAPLGTLKLRDVQPRHIEAVLASAIERGMSGTSCRRIHTAMSSMFKLAVKSRVLTVSPVHAVTAPKQTERRMELPTPEQVGRILHELNGEPNAVAYTLLLYTGARRAEIAALRWQDVDFGENRVSITGAIVRLAGKGLVYSPPKTQRSNRTIDVDPDVMQQLRQHRLEQMRRVHAFQGAVRDEGWVFTSETGSVVDPAVWTKTWGRAAKRCGVKARLHDARHFAISHMLANETPLHVVQAIAGHASATTTLQIYSHVLPAQGKAAATVIGKVMAGSAE